MTFEIGPDMEKTRWAVVYQDAEGVSITGFTSLKLARLELEEFAAEYARNEWGWLIQHEIGDCLTPDAINNILRLASDAGVFCSVTRVEFLFQDPIIKQRDRGDHSTRILAAEFCD